MITVHDCEPDVDVICDGCKENIDSIVFCAECAGKAETHLQERCSGCGHMAYRIEMFSKIGKGKLCHSCAFKHEYELISSYRRKARKRAS